MSKIHFKPWVGNNYWESAGSFKKRILVLGESHYGDEESPSPLPPKLTVECIEGQISGKLWRFFTIAAKVFLGGEADPSLEDKKTFWHSVAFANFVQESVGSGPGTPPTKEMWEKGRSAFPEMLSELRPQLIAVLGFSLWRNLPASKHKGPDIADVKNDESKITYFHFYPGGKALAFRMVHPSWRGFKYCDWAPGLKEAINKAPSD